MFTITVISAKYIQSFDRLLVIYSNVKYFRHFLDDREFTIFTEHKPLTIALHSKKERTLRQVRCLESRNAPLYIQYIKGDANIVTYNFSHAFEVNFIMTTDLNQNNNERSRRRHSS